MPDTITLTDQDNGVTFSIPKNIDDRAAKGDEEAIKYVNRASAEAASRKAYLNTPAIGRFISGLGEGLKSLWPGNWFNQTPEQQQMGQSTADALIGKKSTNPLQERFGALNQEDIIPEMARSTSGQIPFMSGDIAGDTGRIIPGLAAGALASSPAIRAGTLEGLRSAGNELWNIPSPYQLAKRGGLGTAIGTGVGALAGHPFVGMEIGGLTGALGNTVYKGGRGFLRGFSKEPRLFNWSGRPVYDAEFVEPGPHPFQFSGNSPSMRLPPPNPEDRVFNMPGSFGSEYVPNAPLADYPPNALPPAEYVGLQQPPVGSHNFEIPPILKGIAPGPTWADIPSNLELTRTRGAIPMSDIGGNTYISQSGQPQVKPPISRMKTGRQADVGKQVEVKNPLVGDKDVQSKETKETSNKSEPTTKNVVTDTAAEAEPQAVEKFISMTDTINYAKNNGLDINSAINNLKNEGYQVVSDFDLAKKQLGAYGLNIKGRKIR